MQSETMLAGLAVDPAACIARFGLYLKPRGERPANPDQHGPSGFRFIIVALGRHNAWEAVGSVIVSQADHDREEWIHASIARKRLPSYDDLCALKAAVWGDDGYAYQVFPARSEHVNIHERALHLWGRDNGSRVLPAFGQHGTI